jgi:hypothetical protein
MQGSKRTGASGAWRLCCSRRCPAGQPHCGTRAAAARLHALPPALPPARPPARRPLACRTRCVAVAVSAMMGTPGSVSLSVDSWRNAGRKSWPYSEMLGRWGWWAHGDGGRMRT